MAIVPGLLGMTPHGIRPLHFLLLAAWLAGFHLLNALTLWHTARRNRRRKAAILPALWTWAGATAVLGLFVLGVAVWLLLWAIPLAPLLVIAVAAILLGHHRGLISRCTTILAATLMLPISASLPGIEDLGWCACLSEATRQITGLSPMVWACSGVLAAFYLGSVPHVRSMIRGWGKVRWVVAAAVWHWIVLVVLTIAVWRGALAWWILPMWGLLLARVLVVPWWFTHQGRRPRPRVLGISEIVAALLVTLGLCAQLVVG